MPQNRPPERYTGRPVYDPRHDAGELYSPMPAVQHQDPGGRAVALTEADVRRIVQDELRACKDRGIL